jgi:DNA mismatch repair ATPase MutL
MKRYVAHLTRASVLLGVQLTVDDFKDFIHELYEHNGSRNLKPKAFSRILATKACRVWENFAGAIMFGDPLTKEQCAELVRRLTLCKNPFVCAHSNVTFCFILQCRDVSVKWIMPS